MGRDDEGNGFYDFSFNSFTSEEKMDILSMKNTPNLYQKLVESIAPSIFGRLFFMDCLCFFHRAS